MADDIPTQREGPLDLSKTMNHNNLSNDSLVLPTANSPFDDSDIAPIPCKIELDDCVEKKPIDTSNFAENESISDSDNDDNCSSSSGISFFASSMS